MREDMDAVHRADAAAEAPHAIDGHALADDLAQELQCGCCSELVYKPVIVSPCEHFFCGRCVLLPFDQFLSSLCICLVAACSGLR